MIGKPTIFLGFAILFGSIFVVLLLSILELESYYLEMNEELTISLDSETKYMVLVDDMFQEVNYDVEYTNDESIVTYPFLPGYRIAYTLMARSYGKFYFLDPYGENTSVTVNDYDGIGTIILPEGDVTIEFAPQTTQTTEMQDSFQFALIPSSMVAMIIFTVLTGIGTLALLIVYIIIRSQAMKQFEENPYGYDYKTNKQPLKDQDLFDMSDDDVFAQYDYNKKNNSSWDD